MKSKIETKSNGAIIVGIGANSLEIPLLIFSARNEAEKFLSDLGLEDGDEVDQILEKEHEETEGKGGKIIKSLFAKGRYYDGCGPCGNLEIRDFEYGKPLVVWNLD